MGKVILFGAGDGGARVAYLLKGYEIVAFADNNKEKHGGQLLGKPIINPLEIKNFEFDLIVIANLHGKAVREQLVKDLGFANGIIVDYFMGELFDIRVATLKMVAEEIHAKKIQGSVAELGVFQGEFAKHINVIFPERKLYLMDTFEGFNEEDISFEMNYSCSDSKTGEFSDADVDLVLNKMKYRDNCEVIKGYFPESVQGVEDIFAFVSLDVDLYKPIYSGLEYFYPRLAKGGYIFIHDYNSTRFGGVKDAVRKYCCENNINIIPIPDLCGTAIITK